MIDWMLATDTSVRSPNFPVPEQRGAFTFDGYGTTGVRITLPEDGIVLPCGYAYWSRVANRPDHLLVLVGIKDVGPSLFKVSKADHSVTPLGPLFPEGHPLRAEEADQWYWSGYGTCIYAAVGNQLQRIYPNGSNFVVFTSAYAHIFQPHSSDDGQVHSYTVKDANYTDLGCVVWKDGVEKYFPITGNYDECQIDASGRWLVIKQGNNDNTIVDLATGKQTMITNADGALGHSDAGSGYAVGEDDMHYPAGRCVKLDLETGEVTLVYHLTAWNGHAGLGHVALRRGFGVVSNVSRENYPRENEIVLITLDGSLKCKPLCPNLVDLDAEGPLDADAQRLRDYKRQPMANLDTLGEYVCWSANHSSDRIDIFLVKIPTS